MTKPSYYVRPSNAVLSASDVRAEAMKAARIEKARAMAAQVAAAPKAAPVGLACR